MVAEHEDDWAPLAPEQLASRPGEQWSGAPAPADAGRQVVAALPTRTAREPDPRAEQLLRDLQDRIARAPKSDSIVASAARRAQRQRRQQRASEAQAAALAGTFQRGSAPPDPAPVLELDRQTDADPRELEDWFRELPEAEQQRLRATWSSERHKFDLTGRDARRRMLRAAAYSGGAFLLTGLLLVLLLGSYWQIPALACVGAVCGPLAQLAGGQRFTYMLFGALGYVVVMGAFLLRNPFLLYGAVFAISLMGAVGMDREMRLSAGCRDD